VPLEHRGRRFEVVGRGGCDSGDSGADPGEVRDRLRRAGRADAEHQWDVSSDRADRDVDDGVGDVGRQRRELRGGAEHQDRVDVADESTELTLERWSVEAAVGIQRRDERWDRSGDELHGWTNFLKDVAPSSQSRCS